MKDDQQAALALRKALARLQAARQRTGEAALGLRESKVGPAGVQALVKARRDPAGDAELVKGLKQLGVTDTSMEGLGLLPLLIVGGTLASAAWASTSWADYLTEREQRLQREAGIEPTFADSVGQWLETGSGVVIAGLVVGGLVAGTYIYFQSKTKKPAKKDKKK